jgi:hypothetical protein
VERFVGMGLVRPVTERPVAGVWARVDSRPVPPSRPVRFFLGAFFFGAGLAFALEEAEAAFLAAGRLFLAIGRLALAAVERRFGADALFALAAFRGAARLTAFPFEVLAFRTGFLAIADSLSVCLRLPRNPRPGSAAGVRGGDPQRLTERP